MLKKMNPYYAYSSSEEDDMIFLVGLYLPIQRPKKRRKFWADISVELEHHYLVDVLFHQICLKFLS